MKKIITLIMTVVLCVCACFALTACGGDKTVQDKGTVIVGITDYKPMDYKDSDGNWIGFDAELSKKVFTSLGYTVEFKEIDWDTKIVTLNAGTIDVIWNGMTVTDELLDNVLLSNVYLKNQQVAVVKTENAGSYTKASDLAGKKVAVESGSAAEGATEDLGCTLRKCTNQNAALMEVYSGTSDVAVVDVTLATSNTAVGTTYYNKLKVIDLGFEIEEFAIAFRKADSKLCFNVNKKINELYKDGTILSLAVKYGVENLLAF